MGTLKIREATWTSADGMWIVHVWSGGKEGDRNIYRWTVTDVAGTKVTDGTVLGEPGETCDAHRTIGDLPARTMPASTWDEVLVDLHGDH